MSIEVWIPEGIHKEFPIHVEGRYVLSAFPYKWYTVEVENEGPDPVEVMVNDQTDIHPVTLNSGESRLYEGKKPTYWQVVLRTETGKEADVIVTTSR